MVLTPPPDEQAPRVVLTGLGIHVRAAVPGYPTTAPDGHRRWIIGHDHDQVLIDEAPDGALVVHTPDLDQPVTVPREDVVRAAAQLANLIAARLHDARHALRVLDDAILPACDVEAQANTIANSLIDERGDQ